MFTLLLLVTFQESPITGGGNVYAATYEELNMYEVRIENNLSKIITTMQVMAVDEDQARHNVYLNGWTVIGVRLLKERVKKPYSLDPQSVATTIPGKIDLENKIEIPKEQVVSKEKGNQQVADNLNLLPTSDKLELIMTIHFKLGDVAPIFDDQVSALFEKLDKTRDYILFGNADDVKVGRKATYGSNYELSYLRAEHIKKLLIEKDHDADRIRTVGLGTRYPLEKSGKKGSLKNRRVEIYGFRTQG